VLPEIHIGPLTLQTFGICFALAFLAAGAVVWRRLEELGKPVDWAYEMGFAAALGGLIGLIGGPAGLAIGATAGFILGAGTDVARARVGRDFVRDVQNELEPGKSALIAQIDEESTEFVDGRMGALGGVVFRRALSDVTDNELERDVSGIQADLAQTRAEHAASAAERKKHLQARIDALNQKLRHAFDRAS